MQTFFIGVVSTSDKGLDLGMKSLSQLKEALASLSETVAWLVSGVVQGKK